MAADYDTLVYNELGGAKLVVADGGTIEIQSGGTLDVLSGANVDLGTFSYSMEVTQADNYPLGVFGRISTAQTTGSTTQRAIWARMDVDANLSGTSSVMGAELQFRFDGATSIGSGVEAEQYTGAWLYFEQDTSGDTLANYCHASASFASVETHSDLSLSANTHLSGIEIASRLGAANGSAWADTTGTTAGLFITKAPAATGVTASDWPYGIFIENVTTAINIAACTTGIALAGAMTDGIIISGTMSSNGLEISSDCTGSGIEISGTNTADITLSSGATIHNGTDIGGDDALVLTENHIQLVASGWGKISFGGMTDWGTGATGTVIDGVGWDWVTQTVGNVASDLPSCAAAASYNALTVTNNQTGTSSLFATWNELYLTGALTLTGSNNYASIYAVIELDSACTLPASSYVLAGVLSHITTVTGNVVNCPIVGFCADSNIHATATWTSHSSAFECKATTKDWDYGVYLDDYTTGIYFAETGAATEHLIDVVDAYLGLVIETGTYGDTATAVKLTSTNTRPASFLFDDGGVNIGGGADVRGVLSRIAVIAQQTGSSIAAMRGQCKLVGTIALTNYHLVGMEGYIEIAGTTTNAVTLETDGSALACVRGRLEVNSDVTHATADTYMTAFFADLKVATGKSITQDTGVLAGVVIDASNVSGAAAAVDYWGHGIYIADDATDCGITIGNAATGILLDGDFTHAVSIGEFSDRIPVTQTENWHLGVFTDIVTLVDSGLETMRAARTRLQVSANVTSGASTYGIENTLRVSSASITLGGSAGAMHFGAWDGLQASGASFVVDSWAGGVHAYVSATTTGWDLTTNGVLTGVFVYGNMNSGGTVTGNGILAGMYITTVAGTMSWDHGIYMVGSDVGVGMTINACTTGINLAGAMTDGIIIGGACGEDGIRISGACTDNGIEITGNCTGAVIQNTGTCGKFLECGTFLTPIVYDGSDDFCEIHASIDHATNAKPVFRIRNSPVQAQTTGSIVGLESTANSNASDHNVYNVWGANIAAQMKSACHIISGGSFVGAKIGTTDLGSVGATIDAGAIAAGCWVTTGWGQPNDGLHAALILSSQGSLPMNGIIIIPDSTWQGCATAASGPGTGSPYHSFIYTMDDISDWGSDNRATFSNGTLTATGTLEDTDVKCDARMRIRLSDKDYWVALYDTAP